MKRWLFSLFLFLPFVLQGQGVVTLSTDLRVKPSDIIAPSLDSAEVGRVADDTLYLFFSESLNRLRRRETSPPTLFLRKTSKNDSP